MWSKGSLDAYSRMIPMYCRFLWRRRGGWCWGVWESWKNVINNSPANDSSTFSHSPPPTTHLPKLTSRLARCSFHPSRYSCSRSWCGNSQVRRGRCRWRFQFQSRRAQAQSGRESAAKGPMAIIEGGVWKTMNGDMIISSIWISTAYRP